MKICLQLNPKCDAFISDHTMLGRGINQSPYNKIDALCCKYDIQWGVSTPIKPNSAISKGFPAGNKRNVELSRKSRPFRNQKYKVDDMMNCQHTATIGESYSIFSLYLQCESKKSPLRTCGNFSKTVGNFSTKFYVPIMRSYLR